MKESSTLSAESRAAVGSSALFGDFVFKYECKSFCDAYVCALRILGEEAKEQWTREDVVKAVLRAALSPNAAMSDGAGGKLES